MLHLDNRAFSDETLLVCIGMHLARMELRLAVAHFFRRFPRAKRSIKEGMSEADVEQEMYFLVNPKGHRCLIDPE